MQLVEAFAQFGMDPQVQRLQRQYLRGEVRAELGRSHGGNRPEDWLNTRGKAFFFSMKVNLPAWAYRYFRQAVNNSGAGMASGSVTDAVRTAVSNDLENQFRHSGIRAFQNARGTAVNNGNPVRIRIPRHHTLSFWGTQGRNQGIAECDAAITEFHGGVRILTVGGVQVRDPWTIAQWRQHHQGLQIRQTRYQKTNADINAALNRNNIEPDIPPEYAYSPVP
ncbi:MAG: hypothetical protein F6K10_38485 [Moorea sp. SIO2B7]|nr:hypothetical protein [Moorena sp. SIO2B7]